MDNKLRGIKNVPIKLETAKLFVFVDASFANNNDLTSQLGVVIAIGNEEQTGPNTFKLTGNLIHWTSVKCRRVTRAVLASELYAMVLGVDLAIAIKSTLDMITTQLNMPNIPSVICTDSFSLYECLIKLGTTKEKRLMIDIMSIRESYERHELSEMRWINGNDNPGDSMTKDEDKCNNALRQLVETNTLEMRVEGWVERPASAKSSKKEEENKKDDM